MLKEVIAVKIRYKAALFQHRYAPAETRRGEIPRPEEEVDRALYKNTKGEVILPCDWIKAAMVKAGSNIPFKKRKTCKDIFKASIFIEPAEIPFPFSWEIDIRPVVVNRGRILRARPRFDKWEAEFSIVNMNPEVTEEMIKEALRYAGELVGIGDGRPQFGRFTVESFKVIEKMGGDDLARKKGARTSDKGRNPEPL